jgi:hypothetical protein
MTGTASSWIPCSARSWIESIDADLEAISLELDARQVAHCSISFTALDLV